MQNEITMSRILDPQRKGAGVAASTWLLTLPFVVFAYFAIHDRLIVAYGAAETARNFIAHERLFRISIASNVIYCAGFVLLLGAGYVIFTPVKSGPCIAGGLLKAGVCLMTLNRFDALRLECQKALAAAFGIVLVRSPLQPKS